MTIVSVSSGNLELLVRFYQGLYCREFPDLDERESLANMENYLRLKEQGWYGLNNYHILLATNVGGDIMAGTVADYLALPNTGVVEFLVIDPSARGQGLGRRLISETIAAFQKDAQRAGHKSVDAVCGEVNDPYRRCDIDDHLDGFIRLKIWNRYGFRLLDFPYVQPALGEGQAPVRGLRLMFRPMTEVLARSVPAYLVEQIVREFQIWAMRINDPDSTPVFAAMRDYLRNLKEVPLSSMLDYIAEEAPAPLKVVALEAGDQRFSHFERCYTREFNDEKTAVGAAAFEGGSHSDHSAAIPYDYWLWGLEVPDEEGFSGFASFFSFPSCGFGGYVALCGSLRGKGNFRRLLRMIERQIVEVNGTASGWYVECEPSSSESTVFQHCGFTRVPVTYLQPRLPTDVRGGTGEKELDLLYKPFGSVWIRPTLTPGALRRDLLDIIHAVYLLDDAAAAAWQDRMNWPESAADVFG